jgi:hypothetical protein
VPSTSDDAVPQPPQIRRRRFLALLGVGGVAASAATAGYLANRLPADASAARERELGMYAAGAAGIQQITWSLPTTAKLAALTFDDGPNPMLSPPMAKNVARRS